MFIIHWNHHRWQFATKQEQTNFKDFWKLRGECRVFEIKQNYIPARIAGKLTGENYFLMIPE